MSIFWDISHSIIQLLLLNSLFCLIPKWLSFISNAHARPNCIVCQNYARPLSSRQDFFSKSLAWAFQVKPHAFNAYSIGIYPEWINCYFFLFLHIFHILHHNSNSNIWTMCKLYCPVTPDVHIYERQSRLFCLHTHILDCYEPIMNVFPTVSQKMIFFYKKTTITKSNQKYLTNFSNYQLWHMNKWNFTNI